MSHLSTFKIVLIRNLHFERILKRDDEPEKELTCIILYKLPYLYAK